MDISCVYSKALTAQQSLLVRKDINTTKSLVHQPKELNGCTLYVLRMYSSNKPDISHETI